jgi:hypothetical protein
MAVPPGRHTQVYEKYFFMQQINTLQRQQQRCKNKSWKRELYYEHSKLNQTTSVLPGMTFFRTSEKASKALSAMAFLSLSCH